MNEIDEAIKSLEYDLEILKAITTSSKQTIIEGCEEEINILIQAKEIIKRVNNDGEIYYPKKSN